MKIKLLFLLVLLQGTYMSQVLPSNRSVDWTLAGLNDTNTIGFTLVDVSVEGFIGDGLTPNDALFDSLLLLNYSQGVHFYFPQGNYVFNTSKNLPSNCLISGAGPTNSKLIFDLNGSGHGFHAYGNAISTDTSSIIEAGSKGNYFIRIANPGLYFEGNWIRIQQDDVDLVTSSWALNSVGQICKILNVSGDTLWLQSELRLDYPLNRNPLIKKLNMKRNIGIQCLSIERMDNTAPEQASVIQLAYVENAWISGIESYNTTFAHIECENSSNIKVEKCFIHDGFEYGGNGRAYGVVLHFTTNECLIENNVFKHLRHSVLLQAGSNGNVISFNYSSDPFWENSNPLLSGNSAGELVLHGNYVYANLFEQNVVQNIVIDNSHGANGPYNTFLRNRAKLYGIFFSDGTSPSQNFIGNEVTNTSFPYSAVNYSIQGIDHFSFGNNNKGVITPAGTQNLLDISYYYSQKPEFVQEYQWGKIGPPNAMNTANIPAYDRFENNQIFAGACGSEDYYAGIFEQVAIEIYPNPAGDHLFIPSSAVNSSYSILDFQGHVWQEGMLVTTEKILLHGLPQGMYMLCLGYRNFRFIKL